jgi:hypothetical protein
MFGQPLDVQVPTIEVGWSLLWLDVNGTKLMQEIREVEFPYCGDILNM